MNQYIKYALTVAVTAAAMLAYQYEGEPEQVELAQQAPSQVPEIKNEIAQVEQAITDESVATLKQSALVAISPSDIDWAAVKSRIGSSHDPMIVFAKGEFSEAEIAAYNKLHVIPFNPEVDLVCTEETYEGYPGIPDSGGVQTLCKSVRARPNHAYEDLDLEELSALAYSDAEAAVFAGRKSEISDQKAEWMTRAAAISGKSGPLLWLAENEHPSTAMLVPVAGGYKEVPLVEDIVRRAILENVAAKMGDPRAAPTYYKEELSKALGADAKSGLDAVEALTQRRMAEIDSIRTELGLGPIATLGGESDA